jgi:predicted enzyme related to lactoylglutathione lyase
MINYRVRDLDALLATLEAEGVRRDGGVDEYWYGRFAWVFDGEGNRVELWEPARMSIEEFERRLRER